MRTLSNVFTRPIHPANLDSTFGTERDESKVDSNLVDVYTSPVEVGSTVDFFNLIDTFENFPNNWDGYGAIPPSTKTVCKAKLFVNLLPEVFLFKLSTEDVLVTPYGTILFLWDDDDDSVSIEIGDTRLGLVKDIDDIQEIVLNGIIFDGEELPNEVVKTLFEWV